MSLTPSWQVCPRCKSPMNCANKGICEIPPERKAETAAESVAAAGASHTPGPWQWYWRIDDDLHADCGVFHEKREGHAYSVCRAPRYAGQKQWEADARLIAAAPDLLAVAEEYLRFLYDELHGSYTQSEFDARPEVESVRAAIKKAKGQ